MSSAPLPTPSRTRRPSWADSLKEYGRGVVGGLLFSLPLLFTMEVWQRGIVFTPARLLVGLVATYGLLLLYNQYAGLRANAHRAEVWIDSVEELGLGLVLSAALLALLGRLGGTGLSLNSAGLGLVVLAAMAVAVGVSVGTAQLGASDDGAQGQQGDEDDDASTLASNLGLGLCGAVLLALNIAPTEEVMLLAAELTRAQLLGVAALSVALCSVTLFFSDFHGSRPDQRRTSGDLLRGTVNTYAVALLASGFLLWFIGRFDGAAPFSVAAQTAVLGLPAALGASAGRLLLRP